MSKLFSNKYLLFIVLLGLLLRLLFIFWGGKIFWGRENIFVEDDTYGWSESITSLIENGTYTFDSENEFGPFARMPGYSFFLGIFYFLSGKNWNHAYPMAGWFQTLADLFLILLVYRISFILSKHEKVSLLSAFLYASYPFIIVWTPVTYSEWLGITCMLLCIYFILSEFKKYKLFLCGIFLGIAILNRPQIALLVFAFLTYIIFVDWKKWKTLLLKLSILVFGIFCSYGPWPLRNYINYNKLVFTQDLRGFPRWNIDVVAFLQYIYSVKAEWEPQFSAIINNKTVIFPPEAYKLYGDSLKLERAVDLSKHCGSGFSYWRKYWKSPIKGENCNEEISGLFNELRENQIKNNPFNYYLWVPLNNLKKSLFKNDLQQKNSLSEYISRMLFFYRTFLILSGLAGCILLMRRKKYAGLIFLSFFIVLYLTLCFGTGVQMRNIEIRYFLPADILLLFPVAYFFDFIIENIRFLLFPVLGLFKR